MNCNRCGRPNPLNTKFCVYCGAPLMNNKKKKQKQTENLIVALIIIMVVLLVVVAGVLIYKNNSKNKAFDVGGGYSKIPAPTMSTVATPIPTPEQTAQPTEDIDNVQSVQNDVVIVEEKSINTTPNNSNRLPDLKQVSPKQPSASNERLSTKERFLEKAYEIQLYSEEYLDTAQTQSEINYESGVVYQKWDNLLNEIYQYLKSTMSDSVFKQLQKDEHAWVQEKENAIAEAAIEWGSGTGSVMAQNCTAIEYTADRCYYLISLIN